ncbi:MAG: hypothetical protein A3F84_12005 [Candidatus Handelsmanbacteria bacterium RIFCSPLOWO2_12_FULL_64_10]|uniref:Response regulatory domain-containing protein n=1 Tax=Handelsmanbacteria sp. (strain RIFCSPLOWO2_12_FULL_64_10) TaxID=1817868 RepID=A0A1F6CLP6_HANXR|nr:MAG: hypothetical protein A3F84_12005 [Candidatus Handelsmanbacteria bacterium RIFCSPLOWO2_12_FULL_64_10]
MSHILVVDDDPEVRRLTALLLKTAGHTVAQAPGGRQALDRVKAHPPDLVLSDIGMPEMDGCALFREVRAYDPQIPFVAMSGHMDAQEAGQHAFDGFVRKPFNIPHLIETVDRTVRTAQEKGPRSSQLQRA